MAKHLTYVLNYTYICVLFNTNLKPTLMKNYKQFIMAVINCTETDAEEIESYMRDIIFHSTLDWQSKSQLELAAKIAWRDIKFMRSPEGIAYMDKLMASI